MSNLDKSSARDYLAQKLNLSLGQIEIDELLGGVSSVVFRVRIAGQADLILKQSLAKLRVREDWYSDRARILREMDALRLLGPVAPEGCLPVVLFEDRDLFLFAMSAADVSARTWKACLLDGQVELTLGRQAAALHAVFFQSHEFNQHFAGLELFDQLRLDPYYRFTATRHPDLKRFFDTVIEQSRTQLVALTHGDWSPKNFLVNPGSRLFSIDYEVLHFGDPSFDVAFLLNHFLLKGWHRASSRAHYAGLGLVYWEELKRLLPVGYEWLEAATIRHLGCLQLARVDGKSPVEYLRPAEQLQVRRFARDLIQNPPAKIAEVFEIQAEAFHE